MTVVVQESIPTRTTMPCGIEGPTGWDMFLIEWVEPYRLDLWAAAASAACIAIFLTLIVQRHLRIRAGRY